MEDRETREAWAVIVNTDLTEGRGSVYVKHICDLEATAVRLAKGADVQGSDGRVSRITLEKKNATWLGPVNTKKPTDQDKKYQLVIDAKRDAENKARSLGLTDDDLAALRRA